MRLFPTVGVGLNLHALALCFTVLASTATAEVHQANGIKIGEVDQTSALIWARLTQNAQPNHDGADFIRPAKRDKKNRGPLSMAEQLPEGKTLADMRGAVPGAAGSVRISWTGINDQKTSTEWIPVNADKDYTAQYCIKDLKPGGTYTLTVESRDTDGQAGQGIQGKFRTAPAADQEVPISLVVVSCQEYSRRDSPEGHKIYPSMLALDPDFFVYTGDIEYYDIP